MSNASRIELWRGQNNSDPRVGAIPDNTWRQYIKPQIRVIVDEAEAALAAVGITAAGHKRGVCWAVGKRFVYYADAPTPSTFNLYFKPGSLAGRFDHGRQVRDIAHELVHNERMKLFSFDLLGEFAATEALAYLTDRQVEPSVRQWQPRSLPLVEQVKQLPKQTLKRMIGDFGSVLTADTWSGPDARYWMATQKGMPVRRAEIVGIATTLKRFEEGHTSASLLAMPAREMMGYEAAA